MTLTCRVHIIIGAPLLQPMCKTDASPGVAGALKPGAMLAAWPNPPKPGEGAGWAAPWAAPCPNPVGAPKPPKGVAAGAAALAA